MNLIILLTCAAVWFYCAFPVLRYAIDLSEGRLRWKLIPWLAGLLIAIQLMKRSLFLLAGWPKPDSWGSRLFLALCLLVTYLIPFVYEILKQVLRKK